MCSTIRRLIYLLKKVLFTSGLGLSSSESRLATPEGHGTRQPGAEVGEMRRTSEGWVVLREVFGLPKEGVLGCPHKDSCFFPRGTHFVLQVFSMQMDRTGLPSHAASPMPGARVLPL